MNIFIIDFFIVAFLVCVLGLATSEVISYRAYEA